MATRPFGGSGAHAVAMATPGLRRPAGTKPRGGRVGTVLRLRARGSGRKVSAAPALLGWAVGDTDGGGAFPTEGTRAPRPRASCCGREGAAGSRRSHAREGWLSRWGPGVQSVDDLAALYLPAGSRQTSFLLGSQDGRPGCSQADTQRPGGQGSRSPPWNWLRTRRPVTRREMKPIRVCLGAGPPLLAPR